MVAIFGFTKVTEFEIFFFFFYGREGGCESVSVLWKFGTQWTVHVSEFVYEGWLNNTTIINLIFIDPCIVVWLSRNTNKMQLVIEFIIPKLTESSTCFERHTAHHQELWTVFAASGLYTARLLLMKFDAEWHNYDYTCRVTRLLLPNQVGALLDSSWNVMAHGNAGRGSEGETGEWSG
jgi:hypothetical protein